jgi:hypothetical protein
MRLISNKIILVILTLSFSLSLSASNTGQEETSADELIVDLAIETFVEGAFASLETSKAHSVSSGSTIVQTLQPIVICGLLIAAVVFADDLWDDGPIPNNWW